MGNITTCVPTGNDRFIPLKQGNEPLNERDYRILKEIHDPRFELIQIREDPRTKHVIYAKEKEIDLSFEKLEELKFRSQLSNSSLLTIYGYRLKEELKGACVYFEAFDGDLEQQIQQALLKKEHISEENLSIILHCGLNALSYLQEQNISHQNITPTQILRIGKNYKLHDNFVISEGTTLTKQGAKNKDLRYIAPEILETIVTKDNNKEINYFKADIYSLGICILDAGVLNDVDITIIDRRKLKIMEQNLEARIRHFCTLYSPELGKVIREMLRFDPEKRPDPIQIYNRMPAKWREHKRRPFVPAEPVERLGSEEENLEISKKSPFKKITFSHQKRSSSFNIQNDSMVTSFQIGHLSNIKPMNEPKDTEFSQPYGTPMKQTTAAFRNVSEAFVPSPRNDKKTEIVEGKISSPIKNDPVLSQIIKKMYSSETHRNYDQTAPTNATARVEGIAQIVSARETRTPLCEMKNLERADSQDRRRPTVTSNPWGVNDSVSSSQGVGAGVPQPKILKTSTARYTPEILFAEKRKPPLNPSTQPKILKHFQKNSENSFRGSENEVQKENYNHSEDSATSYRPVVGSKGQESSIHRQPTMGLDLAMISNTFDSTISALNTPSSLFRTDLTRVQEPSMNGSMLNIIEDYRSNAQPNKLNSTETEQINLTRPTPNQHDTRFMMTATQPTQGHRPSNFHNLFASLTSQPSTARNTSLQAVYQPVEQPTAPLEKFKSNGLPLQAQTLSLNFTDIDNQMKKLSNDELSKLVAEIKKEHNFKPQASQRQSSETHSSARSSASGQGIHQRTRSTQLSNPRIQDQFSGANLKFTQAYHI